MVDGPIEGTGDAVETPEVATQDAGVQTPGPNETGINPAWEPIRERLGDTHFGLIRDELSKWDQSAQQRIESLNSEFSPYKSLGTVDELTTYKNIVEQLNNNPQEMYERLGQYLQQSGLMPGAEEDEAEYEDGEDVEDDRYAQLQQQLDEQRQLFQAQQFQAQVDEARTGLEAELNQLAEAKGYGDEDKAEVLRIAHQLNAESQEFVPLSKAAEYYDSLQQRILSRPRPGQGAPRLLPTNGGAAPSGQPQKAVKDLNDGETKDLVAAMLSQGRQ